MGSKVSKENRELRDELSAKLARFSDYKVIRGETLSPDATTQDFLDLAKSILYPSKYDTGINLKIKNL